MSETSIWNRGYYIYLHPNSVTIHKQLAAFWNVTARTSGGVTCSALQETAARIPVLSHKKKFIPSLQFGAVGAVEAP